MGGGLEGILIATKTTEIDQYFYFFISKLLS